MTRQQHYLTTALDHVRGVRDDATLAQETRDIYGGVCHTFPVLVRSAGLCQTLAYVEAKAAAGGARGKAYDLLRAHAAVHLGVANPKELLDAVRGRDTGVTAYMQQTRTLLAAWIYYKRFAVSYLKVASGAAAQDDAPLPAEPVSTRVATGGER